MDAGEIFQMVMGVLLGGIAVFLVVAFFVWLIRDAESRGKSGCLVCLLVLLLHIPGLIIWLLIRPEKTQESPLGDQSREQ